MLSIFFDLETSESHFAGQILNYSFLVVDQNWSVIDELTASVKLSPLQLPAPGAILVNRVNVKQQAEEATETECEAAKKIYAFIGKYVAQSQVGINLIGYNSNNFDVQYIRTVLIRNGLNPFFSGKVQYRDLLHLIRKLACTKSDFPREIKTQENGHRHYSYSLQSVSTAFALLKSEQTHYSKDDVLLTIELSQYLAKHYDIDIRSFNSNEVADISEPGKVVFQLLPEYDPTAGRISHTTPLALLKSTNSGSFWINLNSFVSGSQDRTSLQYISKIKSFFIADEPITQELKLAARKAMEKFKGFDPETFYPASTCYIEQDIYRLFRGKRLDRLFDVIRSRQCDIGEDEEVRLLFDRYRLENHDWQAEQNTGGPMWAQLRNFALLRYAGNLQLSRSTPTEELDAEQHAKCWAPGFIESQAEIHKLLTERTAPEDQQLLVALDRYYLESPINRAAGFII